MLEIRLLPCAIVKEIYSHQTKLLKKSALEVYEERLNGNMIKDHLKDLESETKEMCEQRMKLVKLVKTDPWSLDELKEVLKKMAKDKSRDAEGYANEIFKEGAAGTDLLEAVLSLINLI